MEMCVLDCLCCEKMAESSADVPTPIFCFFIAPPFLSIRAAMRIVEPPYRVKVTSPWILRGVEDQWGVGMLSEPMKVKRSAVLGCGLG